MHWKTSTTVQANSFRQLFSEATGIGELFGHTGFLTTKSSTELWAKGCALKGKASLLPWTQEVYHHQMLAYMINSALALKKITACSLLANYNENIKMSNIYFVIQTFLVLTEHFREEAAPS